MDETIPLVAEQLDVGVRTVETGRVHIATRVVETEQTVAVPLQRDEVEPKRRSRKSSRCATKKSRFPGAHPASRTEQRIASRQPFF